MGELQGIKPSLRTLQSSRRSGVAVIGTWGSLLRSWLLEEEEVESNRERVDDRGGTFSGHT